jgi:peptidyl-prolyl cis-trans isomerase D
MQNNQEPKIITKKHMARLEREERQKKYLLIGAAVVIFLVVGVIIYGILDQTVLRSQQALAWVDDQKITTQQFENRVKYIRWQLVQQYKNTEQLSQMFGSNESTNSYFANSLKQIQGQLDATDQLGSNTLDQMIDEAVIAKEAKKRGITVTEQEVDEAIQAAFRYYPNGTPVPSVTPTLGSTSTLSPTQLALVTITPTPTEFPTPEVTATLAATEAPTAAASPTSSASATPVPTSTPYTEAGFKTEVSSYLEQVKPINFSDADLRSIFRNQLLAEKLQKIITADVGATQEQVWARHILVDDETIALAALERIKNGEDWAKVAAELSKDTSNKDAGGDLGWFGKGKMVSEFETAAFALKIGEISQPVKTQFGYHLIQALGHEVRPLTPAEQADAQKIAFSTWLTTAKTEAKITKNDIWKQRVPTEPALN